MKKKQINYAGIPEEVLNMVIGESYGLGDYTVKDELDKYGEDLIYSQHNIRDGHLEWLRAWSNLKVFILVHDLFDDKVILGIDRNPPEELFGKQEDKRNKQRKPRSNKRK